jgi:uncharacterized protein
MPEELTPQLAAAATAQLVILLLGLFVLWRVQCSPAARAHPRPIVLAPWRVSGLEFLIATCITVAMAVFSQVFLVIALRGFIEGGDSDVELVVAGAAFQVGLLLGVAAAALYLRNRETVPPPLPADEALPPPPALPPPRISPVVAGAAAFAAALPLLTAVNIPWTYLVRVLGLPAERQDLVELFARADSVPLIILVSFLAVVVAPIAEELLFRAGLFRFLRTRVPRWVAIGLPAVIFAVLHSNLAALAPLVMLAVVFAIAYERTGRIAVPIIAHALFNLNTLLLLLAGVTT